MIYTRRPIVTAKAAEALMVRTLGSGANGIGYYMYHGGSTPKMGPTAFFSDEPMGMPKISYDFRLPWENLVWSMVLIVRCAYCICS